MDPPPSTLESQRVRGGPPGWCIVELWRTVTDCISAVADAEHRAKRLVLAMTPGVGNRQ